MTEYAMLIALVSLGLVLLLGRFRNAIGNTVRNSTTAMNAVANIQQEQGNATGAAGTANGIGGFLNGLLGAATTGLNAASNSLSNTGTNALNGLGNLLSQAASALGNFNIGNLF